MTKIDNEAILIDTCPLIKTCLFVIQSQKEMPELVEKLKDSYCLKNFDACARKVIADVIGRDKVPAQMMPHQNMWAEQVLADAGKGSFIYNHRQKDRGNRSQ